MRELSPGAAPVKLQTIVNGTPTPIGAKVNDVTVPTAHPLDNQRSSSAQSSKAFILQRGYASKKPFGGITTVSASRWAPGPVTDFCSPLCSWCDGELLIHGSSTLRCRTRQTMQLSSTVRIYKLLF
jgi:hypothetical protein